MNDLNMSIVYLLFLLSWSTPLLGARNKLPSSCSPSRLGLQFNDSAESPEKCPFFGRDRGMCKEVVTKHGYPCEEHTVTTKDGFLLNMQRIKDGHKNNSQTNGLMKPTILLQHGVFMDGVSFMLIGRDSLAFYLADNGFDVWIANSRGTKYSRKQRHLFPFSPFSWDWSLDELAKYDFTATVDYVYRKTWSKVHYLGHSMGAMIAVSAMSTNLTSRRHIRTLSLTSPIVYMNHVLDPFTQISAHLFLAESRQNIGIHAWSPFTRPAAQLARLVCAIPVVNCAPFFLPVNGPNCCLNATGIQNLLAYELQPTSNKLLTHLAQNIRGGGLKKYDYGNPIANKQHHGSGNPPEYNVSNIPQNVPIFVGYGGLDFVADLIDVEFLMVALWNHNNSRIVKKFIVNYAHGDFIMGSNIVDMLRKPLVSFLKSN